ncbi:hypothetical protein MUB24_13755 [Lederbergia sp. NSJ-179]|uniref:hypothetical protein n=1 Tax=Lederbergia sp. NSJ-179 TaxID=2931402 RepID=UPI001FD26DCC|nr:hypothetical protein [Lederbergia sp. NSJ-179]MCJ7841945.1 hypothetical protein [Lederbergia sp. NSJ-179]
MPSSNYHATKKEATFLLIKVEKVASPEISYLFYLSQLLFSLSREFSAVPLPLPEDEA